ncbi:glycoside hydrolase family 13 protein [Ilumatobacter sp.]|uniref:glycoside hydrolase family 13 protein n=1 Tax=Ilumatobacter sp. TaxID=1967498 RepID=UPI003B51BFCA
MPSTTPERDAATPADDATARTPDDDHDDHDGTDRPWWRTATIYQIYPRSFADSDGDGVGDIAGIASKLDHLVELGIDAVWLSPMYPSPQDDAGYDISDYRGIDPLFGSLEDFDALVEALHERGIRLLMDLVVNHTSDEHEWFVESRSATDSPRRDWYWWRPPRDGMAGGEPGAEPNNWGSVFGGPAWRWDEATAEYFLHLFSTKQPDLNWENPDVRAAVYEMMRWWLDRGIDGFRMDVINFISKDPELPDGRVRPGGRFGNGMPHHVDGPRMHEFLAEMRRETGGGPRDEAADRAGGERPLVWVGEMPGVTVDDAIAYTDPDHAEVDMVFQFEHVGVDHGERGRFDVRPLRLIDLKAVMNRWQVGLAETGWNSLYWCNHDQPRVVSRFGDDGEHRERSATMWATVLHLHRGTPFVYQGEELGMTNYPFTSLDEVRDVEAANHVVDARAAGASDDEILAELRAGSRDNARTPVQWDASPGAGFTTGEPWIAINPNRTEINAADQRDDPDSVFHHYRRLVELRHDLDVVVDGEFAMLLADDESIYAFTRTLGDDRLLVLANATGEPVAVDTDELGDWVDATTRDATIEVVIANVADPAPLGAELVLQPWEARVHRRR